MIALNDHGMNSGADAIVDPTGKQAPKTNAAKNYEPLVALIMVTILSILSTLAFQKYRANKR